MILCITNKEEFQEIEEMNDLTKLQIIKETEKYVKDKLEGEGSGHDWWHVYRVWKNAINITKHENADLFTVELAALLHDIADWKFCSGDETIGPSIAGEWLEKQGVNNAVVTHVQDIIKNLSFKGAGTKSKMNTIEGMIVQDADRLDAIGAIGIARTFAYGGYKGREIYNPNMKPEFHQTFEQYKNGEGHTINHFYEKLLLLKDIMNTNAARCIAEERHEFMLEYLNQFYKEWDGNDLK